MTISINLSLYKGSDNNLNDLINPVDTGRKLNEHKTFRRRPGRLLNILITFNLRPCVYGEDS